MKLTLGAFTKQEMFTLAAFGKFAASLGPADRTHEEWFDVYLTFREEHAQQRNTLQEPKE